MPVVKIYDSIEARATILARKPWEDQEMPVRLLNSIERIFGERLSPAEAVGRILADIRRRGDAAVIEWSARIDGPRARPEPVEGHSSAGPSTSSGPVFDAHPEPVEGHSSAGPSTSSSSVFDAHPEPVEGRAPAGPSTSSGPVFDAHPEPVEGHSSAGPSTSSGPVFDAEIPPDAWRAAYERLPEDQQAALDLAARRIGDFHRKQPMDSWVDAGPDGTLGQLIRPLDSVGVYVPGGTAPLPSSLLMTAIPARVAGVGQVIVCTPPNKAGAVHDLILAAAHVAGVDRLFALGGAQAIGALAYGTERVPRVDKILGAGGLFITLAKRQVIGSVGIDGFYGPTETLVIADETADPAWAAADMLAQAEHDVLASPLLLTPSRAVAEAVAAQLANQLTGLTRRDIAAAALADRGGIVVTADLAEAVELANAYAPEHLCLLVADPWSWVGRVRNAGGIFVGEYSFEVLGDYVAGPSHVMPTEGSARYASPISVADFVKRISLVALNASAGARLSAPAAVLARGEGLTAHAGAAEFRLGDTVKG